MKNLVARQEPEDASQKGTYSAGWLAVGPDFDKKVMRRSDEAAWTKGYFLGPHRMMDSWTDQRYKHLVDGKIQDMSLGDFEKAGRQIQIMLSRIDQLWSNYKIVQINNRECVLHLHIL